ncbi:MAG TPA: UrcA family protein [Steroidobacteraceae bacterium]|jgi:UrcA family protein|nr:UrcA family protein [Steroidobacteraceae bacterium]
MDTFAPARTPGQRVKWALMLGTLAGVMAVGVASAGTLDTDVPSVVVKYSKESLATDSGAVALYRRIRTAATQVCPNPSLLDLGAQIRAKQCRAEAIARAIQQIDNSRLAAVHAGHTKNG